MLSPQRKRQKVDHRISLGLLKVEVDGEIFENEQANTPISQTAHLPKQEKLNNEIGKNDHLFGENCPHVPHVARAVATCRHCSKEFCAGCLFGHMERLKNEINWIASNFKDGEDVSSDHPNGNLAAIKTRLDQHLLSLNNQIASATAQLLTKLQNAVLANKERLLVKAKLAAERYYQHCQNAISQVTNEKENQNDIDKRLDQMNSTSLLYYPIEELAGLYESVRNMDVEMAKSRNAVSLPSSIVFDTDNAMVDSIAASVSEIGDVLFSEEELNSQFATDDGSSAPEVMRIHHYAKSNNVTMLKSVFERKSLPRSCHKFIVEHADESDFYRTPLMQAAHSGSIDVLQYLVRDLKANVKATDALDSSMAVHLAAGEGHLTAVKFLIDLDASLAEVKDKFNATPLNKAAASGKLEVVRYLFEEKHVDIENKVLQIDATPLLQAVAGGHLSVIEYLLQHGTDVTVKSNVSGKQSPVIHFAAMNGRLEVVKLLLDRHPQLIDARDSDNDSPLHLAASEGHLPIVEFLLSLRPADLEKKGAYSMTPFLQAAMGGHLQMVKFLLSKGANIRALDSNCATAPNLAAFGGHVNILRFLLPLTLDFVTFKDSNNDGPLHAAAVSGQLEAVECLVREFGADFQTPGFKRRTPLHQAAAAGHLPVVKFLLHKAALLLRADSDGSYPIHDAVRGGFVDVVKFLLEQKPDLLEVKTSAGESLLDLASANNCEEIVELLSTRRPSNNTNSGDHP